MNIDEKTKQAIQDALKPSRVIEWLDPTSPYIETWELRMDGETATLYTANHDGNMPLTNDGSVYFGGIEELGFVCQINGKPHNEKAHIKEHWLMRKVHPTAEPWGIYDNNGQRTYGPFADAEEGEEFARESNFSVEGVWRAL